MCEATQECFFQYLQQNQFEFLSVNSGIISYPTLMNVFDLYLYKADYGEIIMHQNGSMDIIKSPVIQFSKTIIKPEQKKVLRGRLWLSDQYSVSDCLVKKSSKLINDYKMLVRWIKKYVPYQGIKKGEYLVNEYVSDELKKLQESGFVFTI